MNIPLTPDIERTLIEQARKLGTSSSSWTA